MIDAGAVSVSLLFNRMHSAQSSHAFSALVLSNALCICSAQRAMRRIETYLKVYCSRKGSAFGAEIQTIFFLSLCFFSRNNNTV